MLVLKRKEGQAIEVGKDIRIILKEIRRGHVKVIISAPDDVRIKRAESEKEVRLENRRAASSDPRLLEKHLTRAVADKVRPNLGGNLS